MNVCIQVNIDNEESKSGINESAIIPLAEQIDLLDNLTLRGLMIIPSKTDDIEQQRHLVSIKPMLFINSFVPNIYQ